MSLSVFLKWFLDVFVFFFLFPYFLCLSLARSLFAFFIIVLFSFFPVFSSFSFLSPFAFSRFFAVFFCIFMRCFVRSASGPFHSLRAASKPCSRRAAVLSFAG